MSADSNADPLPSLWQATVVPIRPTVRPRRVAHGRLYKPASSEGPRAEVGPSECSLKKPLSVCL